MTPKTQVADLDDNIKEAIEDQLADIERDEGCTILYACEFGSRAWGFPSTDSDYDVRSIYSRPVEWYLSIESGRDVIEKPIVDELDINGWDLRKVLQPLRKSNPALIEWIESPIVYRDRDAFTGRVRELATESYSPKACAYHYRSMARSNYRARLKGEEVSLKGYFYVLRAVLAVKWVESGRGIVPTEFDSLLDEFIKSGPLRQAINQLLEAKRNGIEIGRGPKIPEISTYLDQEMEPWQGTVELEPGQAPGSARFDQFFRDELHRVRGGG